MEHGRGGVGGDMLARACAVGARAWRASRLAARASSSSASSSASSYSSALGPVATVVDAAGVSSLVVRGADGVRVGVVHETPARLVGREVMEVGFEGREAGPSAGSDGVPWRVCRPEAGTVRVAGGGAGTVRVAVPDRGVGVDIATAGGDVEVGAVRYGPLVCRTGGGQMRAGSVNAGAVRIDSGGGDVEASTLSGCPVHVDTGGGRLTVGKVVAPEGELRAGGGAVEVGSLFFGGAVRVECSGAPVNLRTCEPSVPGAEGGLTIATRGGAVRVRDALSGRVSIATGGAPIDVKLDKPHGAELDARAGARGTSGPVSLHLMPGQRYALTVTPPWAKPLALHGGLVREVRREDAPDDGTGGQSRVTIWLEALGEDEASGGNGAAGGAALVLRDNRPPAEDLGAPQWHAVTVHGPGSGLSVDVRSWVHTLPRRGVTNA